jgi:AcrR family transcriptional regulator
MEGAQGGTATPGRRGRPRDQDVEERVFDAAMLLYARHGWVGFTFEAVARETGIGKPALYRRWSSRGDLLAQTFHARFFVVDQIDTGRLADDLLALARMTLEHMLSPYGRAVLHMQVDGLRYPEVRASTAAYRESVFTAAREIVRRGLRRGELGAGTSPALVIDMVVGAAMNHVNSASPDLLPQVAAGADTFAHALVDCVVRGLGAAPAESRAV